MRVFISWSGKQSHTAAVALGKFLTKPWSTNVKTFVSSVDIEAGAQWQAEILGELDASNFGVVCVTRENQHKPWINFEAGAVAKRVGLSRCVPLAIDLTEAEVDKPLGMYQVKTADKAGVLALVKAVNTALDADKRPEPDDLEAVFEAFWPELEKALSEAAVAPTELTGPPEDPAVAQQRMTEEILTTVRMLSSRLTVETRPAGRPEADEAIRTLEHALADFHLVELQYSPQGGEIVVTTVLEVPSQLQEALFRRYQRGVPYRPIEFRVSKEGPQSL